MSLSTQLPRVLRNGLQVSTRRSLHFTQKMTAQRPSIRTRMRTPINTEEALPPLFILESSQKSGFLDLEPAKAMDFLRHYQSLHGKSNPGWEQGICNRYGLKPYTVAHLAMALGRCEAVQQQELARHLLLSASALGDPAATLELASNAFRSNKFDTNIFQRLGILAKQDRNVQAMSLLGQILLSQGKEQEALKWLRSATSEPSTFEGAGEAFSVLGQILLKRNDMKGAEEALKRGALEFDDPSAYFYLSKLQQPGSAEQKVYLLKAASSGIIEAWHNLGAIELSNIGDQSEKKPSEKDYGMAKEWFQVAAEGGFEPSMLNMASICKSQGHLEEASKWLERAEGFVQVEEPVSN